MEIYDIIQICHFYFIQFNFHFIFLRFEPDEEDEESVLFEGENSPEKVVVRKAPVQDQSTMETGTTELSSLGSIPKRYLYIQVLC